MPHEDPSVPPEPIGLVGLGLMGEAIAARLIAGGLQVLGYDIAPSRREAFESLGGQPAAGVAEVAATCGRVILSLPGTPEVAAVLAAMQPSLGAGRIVLDTTTGDPDAAEAVAEGLAGRGISYLDASISGSSAQVRAVDATILCGGPADAFERCRDLFALIARRADHVGPAGSGLRMKLVSNLVLGLNRAALAEALAFARALGLDLPRVLALLRESAGYSRVMDTKGEKMIAGDFRPQARLAQHHKDVRLILGAAGRAGLRLPLSEIHDLLLDDAEAAGFGGLDNAAIVRVYDPFRSARDARDDPGPPSPGRSMPG